MNDETMNDETDEREITENDMRHAILRLVNERVANATHHLMETKAVLAAEQVRLQFEEEETANEVGFGPSQKSAVENQAARVAKSEQNLVDWKKVYDFALKTFMPSSKKID